MQLDEFVSESLSQLVRGITKAQNELRATGAQVVPKIHDLITHPATGAHGFAWVDKQKDNPAFLVDFDLAVTAVEGSGTRAGVGVFAGAIGLGGQARSETTNQVV